MPEVLVGTPFSSLPGARALGGVRFAELAPRAPLPRVITFARWGKQANAEFPRTLVAPRATWMSERGALRDPEHNAESIEWLASAADASGCWGIVLPTGADLTVGARDRELLSGFVAALRERSERQVIWSAGGLWELEDAGPQCDRMGALCAFDPLEDAAPPGDIAYARCAAVGVRPRFAPGHLAQIAEVVQMAPAERVFVSVLAEDGLRSARQLQTLVG